MTEEQQNVATLKKAYDVWFESRGSSGVWVDILAYEDSWQSLADGKPGMEFTKPRASKAEVLNYLDELTDQWSMEFYHVNEFVAQGGRVVALAECSWTHKKTGKTVTIPKVDVWLFENGKATQFFEHYDTHTVLAATVE